MNPGPWDNQRDLGGHTSPGKTQFFASVCREQPSLPPENPAVLFSSESCAKSQGCLRGANERLSSKHRFADDSSSRNINPRWRLMQEHP